MTISAEEAYKKAEAYKMEMRENFGAGPCSEPTPDTSPLAAAVNNVDSYAPDIRGMAYKVRDVLDRVRGREPTKGQPSDPAPPSNGILDQLCTSNDAVNEALGVLENAVAELESLI